MSLPKAKGTTIDEAPRDAIPNAEPEDKGETKDKPTNEEEVDDAPPPPEEEVHQFKFILKNICIYNVKPFDAKSSDPFLMFTLGGNYKVEDLRHRGMGLKVSGQKGPRFRTMTVKKVMREDRIKYPETWVTYWKGTFSELKEQKLLIECFDWDCISKNDYMGSASINLYDLATGSVPHDKVEIQMHARRKRHETTAFLDFDAYFQEIRMYNLHCHDWNGEELIAKDFGGTSDPYCVVSFMSGGTIKVKSVKSIKSEVIDQTLFPEWEDIGTLQFPGIRSELENDDLKIVVYDHDLIFDEKMGETRLPLRGLLDLGFFDTQLEYKNDYGGKISGYISIDAFPTYHQTQDKIELKPYYTYLCIDVNSCKDLVAVDTTGYSSAYVVAEWDGAKQQTRVVRDDLNPVFQELLFIPVRIAKSRIKPEVFVKKGPLVLSVYHSSEVGQAFLGSVTLHINKITDAPLKLDPIAEDEPTRVYCNTDGEFLTSGGERTAKNSQIFFSAFFHPDFPQQLKVPPPEEKKNITIPPSFAEHHKQWKESLSFSLGGQSEYEISATNDQNEDWFLPCFLTNQIPIPRQMRHPRLLMRLVHVMLWAADSDSFSGFSMADKRIFMSPSFIMQIRKGDDQDHSILLVSLLLSMGVDAYLCLGHSRAGNPHVFVMTREFNGSVLFWETTAGISIEAPGRWRGSKECPPDYVLNRNEMLGIQAPMHPLIQKWKEWKTKNEGNFFKKMITGNERPDEDDEEPKPKKEKKKKEKKQKKKEEEMESEDSESRRLFPKAKNTPRKISQLDWDEDEESNTEDNPVAKRATTSRDDWDSDEESNEEENSKNAEEEESEDSADGIQRSMNYANLNIDFVDNGDDDDDVQPTAAFSKSTADAEKGADREDVTVENTHTVGAPSSSASAGTDYLNQVLGLGVGQTHLYNTYIGMMNEDVVDIRDEQGRGAADVSGVEYGRDGNPLTEGGKDVLDGIENGQKQTALFANLFPDDDMEDVATFVPIVQPVILPYSTLDVVLNHTNVWANNQTLDPALIQFDLDDEEQWKPFLNEQFEGDSTYPIKPFYPVNADKLRLAPAISGARAEMLEQKLYAEIRTQFINYRHPKHLLYGWNTDMDILLRNGLIAMEFQEMTGIKNEKGINAWKADIARQIQPGQLFRCQPVQFCFSDVKRIRQYLMQKFDFHKTQSPSVKYSFGVFVCPQLGGCNSVWVCLGMEIPSKDEKLGEKKKVEPKGRKNMTGMSNIKRKW
ncbi:putative tRNA uridine 5-carboxymethylaminomethyl modification enzyme GidA [Blattamonas nauphoetae]|uniref:tRNA uridine 5-carboxymethylaminomethyl modification enzyme GidA n=1 Tax=Blattamonas nauphoetae TaxID=2049346 RepID=A0ABQ9XQV5_9EUKA|nr:putative tRNA uridine 5-carboxymethylaminomethyl modification enzyme GidA [Blattamonas nauphoetae]